MTVLCAFAGWWGQLTPNEGSQEAENGPVAAALFDQVRKSSQIQEGEKEMIKLVETLPADGRAVMGKAWQGGLRGVRLSV